MGVSQGWEGVGVVEFIDGGGGRLCGNGDVWEGGGLGLAEDGAILSGSGSVGGVGLRGVR